MFDHVTVLLKEAVEGLNIKADGIYVDCTLGGAGHSCAILKQLTTGHLYCFDQDQTAIEAARLRLDAVGNNYTIIYSNFVNIKEKLNELGVTRVDGILFDLGVSSPQVLEALAIIMMLALICEWIHQIHLMLMQSLIRGRMKGLLKFYINMLMKSLLNRLHVKLNKNDKYDQLKQLLN